MQRVKIEIHPPSTLVGALVALAAVITVSAQLPITATDVQRVAIAGPVELKDQFDPRQTVRIEEGVPFTVPAGKLFVLTALGAAFVDGTCAAGCTLAYVSEFREDGAIVAEVFSSGGSPTALMQEVPSGLVSSAGSVLDARVGIIGGGSHGVAWGYLIDE